MPANQSKYDNTIIFSPGNLEDVIFAIVFLQSLLIAWFLFLITGPQSEATPAARLLMGVVVLFAIFLPVVVLLEGFRYSSIISGFFIPLVLYALMYSLFNSLIAHTNLFLDTGVLIPAVTGGIGFGLIGLGAYHLRHGVSQTFALVTVGMTLIFLSSPVVLGVVLFVLTGNFTLFPAIMI